MTRCMDNFYDGIATSKSLNSIIKILNRILNIPEIESNSHDKIFCINHLENDFANPLVSLMILAYNEDSSCLPEILNVMSKISSRFYGMTTFEKYKPFFETTKSTTEAFWYYWDNKHKRNFDWSIRERMSYWLDESMILQWINKYQSNYFNDDDVIKFYHELSSFPEKQSYFTHNINEFTNALEVYFANRPAYPREDYTAEYNDLDLVLDRNEFNKVLCEICEGVDSVTIDAIKLHRGKVGNKYHFPYDFIFEVLENNPEIEREGLCNYFTDENLWNLYVIEFLLPKLQNNPKLLSSNHLDFLTSWCRNRLPYLDFMSALSGKKESVNFRYEEYYFSQIFLFIDIELADNILLNLLSMDMSRVDDFEIKSEHGTITISEKILSLVQDKELIKKRVLDNLQNENTASVVILSHIAICKALKIRDAKRHFIRFLREDSLFPYELKRMVELFLEFNGDIRDMDFIINNFDCNNEAHWFVIEKLSSIKNYQKRINPLVIRYSTVEYDDEVQKKAMNQLIRNSQSDGLLKLLQYCEEHYYDSISHYDWAPSISKMPFNDEMILTLEKFIILIVRKIKEDPNNIRGEVSELIFTVLKSFSISVNSAFEKLQTMLLKYLDINNLDMYNFNSKIKDFERHYYYNKKDISTVQEALSFIRSIHADF